MPAEYLGEIDRLLRESPPGYQGPLYKKMAMAILSGIEKGELPVDAKLPTVRQLSEGLGISPGTVAHAYEELERLGAVEKRRGRGTFVRGPEGPEGRKAGAMAAIDAMLNQLAQLGFSPREIRIFLELKLKEREEQAHLIRVAVVDCNPEALGVLSEQVAAMEGTLVQRLLLTDLLKAPFQLAGETDLLLTTPKHYREVAGLFPAGQILRVVLTPSGRTVAALARQNRGRLGILTASERFGDIIQSQRAGLLGKEEPLPRHLLGSGGLEDFLAGLEGVILPEGHERFCPPQEAKALQAFEKRGGVRIPFEYHIDAGSLLSLDQRLAAILESKK